MFLLARNFISLLPEFKGKKRLARLFFKNAISKKRNLLVKGHAGIQYLLPNIIENIGFDIFVNGSYEPNTIQFISGRVSQDAVMLDIGANIGAICIPVYKRRKDLQILAIEASPKVFGYLNENIRLNSAGIRAIQAAVTEINEPVEIYSPDDLYGKGSQSPVYCQTAETVQGKSIIQILEENKVAQPAFIKIDIEGYEYYAFKGASQLLKSEQAPDILFEFNFSSEEHAKGIVPGDAQRLLRSYGYSIYSLCEQQQLLLQKEIIVAGSYLLFASKQPLVAA